MTRKFCFILRFCVVRSASCVTKNKKKKRKGDIYHYYFVVKDKKAVDTRDTKSRDPIDFSKYLNNFDLLK